MWSTSLALGALAASGLLALKRHTDITPAVPDGADLDLTPSRT